MESVGHNQHPRDRRCDERPVVDGRAKPPVLRRSTIRVLCGVWLFRTHVLGQQPVRPYAEAQYQMILLSMPFMTIGLMLGAVWADEAWGAYWSWDPKETWALVTWTLYLMYLHRRRVAPRAGRRLTAGRPRRTAGRPTRCARPSAAVEWLVA